ncbi:MAG: hypothetical protein JKZ03_02875, partial [Flavobacteriaceae bacterium]|nr:hypothetical protein [Flavobacteriaceae bacterium]
MKNLKKNFLFVFVGTFFACESDDDLKLINPSILGTWKLTSLLENGIEQFENGDCDEFLIFKDLTFQLKYFDDENCTMEKLEGPISYALIGDTIKYI